MKICITGMPGSGHNTIAKGLAERLGLDYCSVEDAVCEVCCDDPVLVDMYKEEMPRESADKVNDHIQNFVCSHSDFVCDSIVSNILEDNCLSIFIKSSICRDSVFSRTYYRRRKAAKKYFKAYFDVDCYDESQYAIVIDRTGCTDACIIQFVIDLLIKGITGKFVPADMVLPLNPNTGLSCYGFLNEDYEFSVGEYFGCYVLVEEDDYSQWLTHINRKSLLKVAHDCIPHLSAVQLYPEENYTHWFSHISHPVDELKTCLALAKYCSRIEAYDVEATFIKLEQNGNPLKQLYELGCH